MSAATNLPDDGHAPNTGGSRRPWQAPQLVRYGSMRRLVRAVSGGNDEMGGSGKGKGAGFPFFIQ